MEAERERLGCQGDLGDPQRKNGEDMGAGLCKMKRIFPGQGGLDTPPTHMHVHILQAPSMKKGTTV